MWGLLMDDTQFVENDAFRRAIRGTDYAITAG